MKKRHRINSERFTIRLCSVANTYGFKTVGTMLAALSKANPSAKWSYGTSFVRGAKLINELKAYING
jgi:hypothetical protein